MTARAAAAYRCSPSAGVDQYVEPATPCRRTANAFDTDGERPALDEVRSIHRAGRKLDRREDTPALLASHLHAHHSRECPTVMIRAK